MTTVENVITSFGEAEAALREFLEQAESLGVTERRLATASESIGSATSALEVAKQDLASGVAQMSASAGKLGETAVQFRLVAELLEQLDPADLAETAQETLAEMHKLGTRIQSWLADQEAKAESGREQLRRQLANAEAKLEALHAQSGERSALAQAKLDSVEQSVAALATTADDQMTALRELAAATEGLASRQKIILVLALVAAVLSASAVIIPLTS